MAGLSAAIVAHDAGFSVLVLEKMSQALEGGCSKVSVSFIYAPTDPTTLAPNVAQGAAYLQAMAAGSVEDNSVFTAQAQGYVDNLAMVKSLGGNLGTYTSVASGSYPNAPGISTYHTFAIALPGTPVGSNGYPLGSGGDGRLWQVFRDAATSRNINVMYETPATDLIQNANTKEIIGVKAKSNGTVLNIKANKAVVLACGGVEFALDLEKQFYGYSPVYGPGI